MQLLAPFLTVKGSELNSEITHRFSWVEILSYVCLQNMNKQVHSQTNGLTVVHCVTAVKSISNQSVYIKADRNRYN